MLWLIFHKKGKCFENDRSSVDYFVSNINFGNDTTLNYQFTKFSCLKLMFRLWSVRLHHTLLEVRNTLIPFLKGNEIKISNFSLKFRHHQFDTWRNNRFTGQQTKIHIIIRPRNVTTINLTKLTQGTFFPCFQIYHFIEL